MFFHRLCPSIVAEKMSQEYHVPKSDLGVFSSIFFYPYALLQPFAGLMSDLIEPGYLMAVSHVIASVGALICGMSKSLYVGCIGRFLVGVGCSPTYVPICRIVANWYKSEKMSTILGLLLAIGGLGSLSSQGPLAAFSDKFGWRMSFYGISAIGIFFSFLSFLFVKGDPRTLKFLPINNDCSVISPEGSLGDKMNALFDSSKEILSERCFWMVVLYNVFASGPYFNIGGLWGAPYLTDVFGLTNQETGNILMSLSVGLIVGSLCFPTITVILKTQKWVLFSTSLLTSIAFCVFIIYGSSISKTILYILFFATGAFTNAMTSVSYPMIKGYFSSSVAGTSIGCANTFTFLSSAFFQQISSIIIPKFGKQPNSTKYTEKGYQIGLWVVSLVSLFFSILFITFSIVQNDHLTEEEDGEISEI